MKGQANIAVLVTDGTNCHNETRSAFNVVGGNAEIVHLNGLLHGYDPVSQRAVGLDRYHILAIPGGFSYGDYISAGAVFARYLKNELAPQLLRFIDQGKLMIGICNGFQTLVKSGFLPMLDTSEIATRPLHDSARSERAISERAQEHPPFRAGVLDRANDDSSLTQAVTLTYNTGGRFEDRWVKLRSPPNSCVWTRGISAIDLPVAHGEGRFMAPEGAMDELWRKNLVVFQYTDQQGNPTQEYPANPNGSLQAVAAICDPTGRILGLMPHPERYHMPGNHPLYSLQNILARPYVDHSDPAIQERLRIAGPLPEEGAGLRIFRNAVEYCRENL